MENKLNPLFRLLSLGAAAALLWPTTWWVHLAGLAVLIVIFVLNRRAAQNKIQDPVLAT